MTLVTARLRLRPFEAGDRAPFAALNADPEVMRHFAAPLSPAESDALIDRIEARRGETGLCFFAVERPGAGLIGMCGLSIPAFEAHFTPCVEIGWRFARAAWGQGYATEAARAALDWGFGEKELDEVVAFTAAANHRSRALMARLGMRHDREGGFHHPAVPPGSGLNPLALYRLRRGAWTSA